MHRKGRKKDFLDLESEKEKEKPPSSSTVKGWIGVED
jgi:hypothetical protein